MYLQQGYANQDLRICLVAHQNDASKSAILGDIMLWNGSWGDIFRSPC